MASCRRVSCLRVVMHVVDNLLNKRPHIFNSVVLLALKSDRVLHFAFLPSFALFRHQTCIFLLSFLTCQGQILGQDLLFSVLFLHDLDLLLVQEQPVS